MTITTPPNSSSRILYFTDLKGITGNWKPVFQGIIVNAKLTVADVIAIDIYGKIPNCLKRHSQQQWKLDPDYAPNVRQCIDDFIAALSPRIIVVSCPAVLGIIADGEHRIDMCRGGVYEYNGIPVVVVYPIRYVHTQFKSRSRNSQVDDEIIEGVNEYKIKAGRWTILNDWQKVYRIHSGKVRPQPKFTYSVVRSLDNLREAEDFLHSCWLISVDIETVGPGPQLSCVGYCGVNEDGRMHTFVIPFYDAFNSSGCYWKLESDHVAAIQACGRINLNSAFKTMQNGGYDNTHFVYFRIPTFNYFLDTIHLWHSLYPEVPQALWFITSMCVDDYQFWKDDIKGLEEKDELRRDKDMENHWQYNARDCYYTALNTLVLCNLYTRLNWAQFNYSIEFPLAIITWHMSIRGIRADKERRKTLYSSLMEEHETAYSRLRTMVADEAFNVNSPQQKAILIYDLLGAKERKIGKNSLRSTAEVNFKIIRTEAVIYKIFIDAIWNVMKPEKAAGEFANAHLMRHGRVHTRYSPLTETWRLRSKESDHWDGRNLQNVPKKMRDWLIADPGGYLTEIDYSQSDAFFMAFESQDENYMNTMTSGKDTHAIHAAHFFKTNYERVVKGVTDEERREIEGYWTHPTRGVRPLTKRIVHGSNFQMAAKTLFYTMGREAVIAAAKALGHSDAHHWPNERLIKLCGDMLKSFHKLYLGLKPFYEWLSEELAAKSALVNAFGMTRIFFGDVTDAGTQREATAFFGQSGTAGNINRAIIELYFGTIIPRFRDAVNPAAEEQGYSLEQAGGRLLLQTHDSITFWNPYEGHIERINNTLTTMERPVIIHSRSVTVPCDVKVGMRWGKPMIPWNRNNPPSLDQIRATW